MSRQMELYAWKQELASRFPGLSPAFVGLLALWSLGMALTRNAGLVVVTNQWVLLLGQPFDTVRQRLREFYQPARAKAGAKRGIRRRDFEAADHFAPLLAWVLSFWKERRLALALDATNLGDRFHVLCVSVLFGGIGIPVAWAILPGGQKGSWSPLWIELLARLRGAVPADWRVVVLSDRGLESAALFRAIVAQGWHPLMRVKAGGKFRPDGWKNWYALDRFARRGGARFALAGVAYKTAKEPLACTLLAVWDERHEGPWLLLTDLPPGSASPCWYAWRAWIEQGFKVIKSAGLQWQRTRMVDCDRLERLWLALAVTTLWLVAVGAEVERRAAIETVPALPAEKAEVEAAPARRERLVRLFNLGQAAVMAALVRGLPLPAARLPELNWPEPNHEPFTLREEDYAPA